MTAAITSRLSGRQPQPGRRRPRVGAVAGLLGTGEITASLMHPGLAMGIAIMDAFAVTAVIILIVRGSDRTWERIFRLLRWASGRPEPPAPPVER